MRTKEYDVQFNDGRLSIVRLRDGAPVVDSVEIPADAVGAAVAVLSSVEVARIEDSDKRPTGAKTQESRAGARKAPPAEERPTGAKTQEFRAGARKASPAEERPTGAKTKKAPRGSAN